MKAIVMAGGMGTRLAPLTKILPKPLLPLNDRPILDIIIEQLSNHGVTQVLLALGYKAEMIKTYFPSKVHGVKISYSVEKERLGTAGPLTIAADFFEDDFLILNADVLTNINFKELFEYHLSKNAIFTVATCQRQEKLELGIIDAHPNNRVKKFIEKPTYKFYVSMGIYAANRKIMRFMKRGKYLDIPDLINKLIKAKLKVMQYKNDSFWMDLGRYDDYMKAQEIYPTLREQLFQK